MPTFFALSRTAGTVADLPAAFEAKRALNAERWHAGRSGLLPQEQLAYAFTLRRLGRMDEGRRWLEAFIAHDPLMPRRVRHELRALFDIPTAASP